VAWLDLNQYDVLMLPVRKAYVTCHFAEHQHVVLMEGRAIATHQNCLMGVNVVDDFTLAALPAYRLIRPPTPGSVNSDWLSPSSSRTHHVVRRARRNRNLGNVALRLVSAASRQTSVANAVCVQAVVPESPTARHRPG